MLVVIVVVVVLLLLLFLLLLMLLFLLLSCACCCSCCQQKYCFADALSTVDRFLLPSKIDMCLVSVCIMLFCSSGDYLLISYTPYINLYVFVIACMVSEISSYRQNTKH